MKKYSHGFLVSRFQPFHNGHKSLVDKMLQESKNATIILALAQESRTQKNPFTPQERMYMVKNVYGDLKNLNIFALDDIPDDGKWRSYILKNLEQKSAKFGKPEAFYAGGEYEASWFDGGDLKIEILDRTKQKDNLLISGTEIRDMIRRNDDSWKKYIPEQNVKFVEDFFRTHKIL